MARDYCISRLDDYSRLNEVYRLTHDSLVDMKCISPQIDGEVSTFPHLDRIPQTTIIIAEKNRQIVGTISITRDSAHGLPSEHYFEEETRLLRAASSKAICVAWRIAIAKEYRNHSRTVLDMMSAGFKSIQEKACEQCLAVLAEKHIKVYQRLVRAEIVAKKLATLDTQIEIPMVLMKMDVSKGWEKFQESV